MHPLTRRLDFLKGVQMGTFGNQFGYVSWKILAYFFSVTEQCFMESDFLEISNVTEGDCGCSNRRSFLKQRRQD